MTGQPRDLAADPNASAPACISDERLAELVDIYLRDMEHAKIWVGEESLEKDVHAALSELAALRRPVEQSREIEAIRKTYKLGPATHTEIERLLSALDQAQREIAGMARDNQSLTELIRQQRDEIARLSSPPQERAEIVERQAHRRALEGQYRTLIMEDLDTLLGDGAAWRNAHALVTAERDEARGKVEELQKDLDHKAKWGQQFVDLWSAGEKRIERLQGVLRTLIEELNRRVVGLVTWDEDGAVGPVEVELSWESIARLALDYTKASSSRALSALTSADGPALAASQHTAGSGDGVAGD